MRESRAFREGLKRAIPQWTEEGIIDDAAAQLLWGRYGLDEDGASLASIAVYILGALLIGGGVISLVAWNWEALPDWLKLSLVTSAQVGSALAGYFMWKIERRRARLGHALIFLGTLIFGANIGLVAQVFHIHDDVYNGVGAWALGACAMAWAVRSVPIAGLSVVLGSIWSFNYIDHHEALFPFSPYLLLLLFIPLALSVRSIILFVMTVVAAFATWCVCAFEQGNTAVAGYIFTLLAAALILLFSVGLRPEQEALAPSTRMLGLMGMLTLCYLSSFHGVAKELDLARLVERSRGWLWLLGQLPLLLGAGLLLARRVQSRWPWDAHDALALAGALGAFIMVPVALLGAPIFTVVMSHLALGVVVVLLIRRSIGALLRGPFWVGVLVAGLVIVSRFFEFETGLLIKGLVFLSCGVVVIAVGVVFERRLKEARHG